MKVEVIEEPEVEVEEIPQTRWVMESSKLEYEVQFINSKAVAPIPEMDTLRSALASVVTTTSANLSQVEALCEVAKTTLGCAWAGICLVGKTTGQYVATSGFSVASGHHFSRDELVEAHVIMSADHPLVLLNTEQDVRCWGNALFRNNPVGFYAGFPLVSASGLVIGALSVGDVRPREAILCAKLRWVQQTLVPLIVSQVLALSKLDEDFCPQEVDASEEIVETVKEEDMVTKKYEAEELKTQELESQQTQLKIEMTNAQEQMNTIESLKKEVATKTEVFTAQNQIFDQLNDRYQEKEQKVLDQAKIISDMTAQLQKQVEEAALFEQGMQEKLIQLESAANFLVSENKKLNRAKQFSQEIEEKLKQAQLHEAAEEKKQLEALLEEKKYSMKVMEEQAQEMIEKMEVQASKYVVQAQEMNAKMTAQAQEMNQIVAANNQDMEEKSKVLAAAQIQLEEQNERLQAQLEEMSKLAKEKARFQNLLEVQAKTFQTKSEKDKARHAEEMDLAIKKVEHHLEQQLKHCQIKLDEEKLIHAEALRKENMKFQVKTFKKELQQGKDNQQEEVDASKKETKVMALQLKTLVKDNGKLQDRIADLKKQKMSVQEQATQYLKHYNIGPFVVVAIQHLHR